jgi:hypothetical protein
LWDEEPGLGVDGWEELAGGVELPEGVGWAPRRRVRPSDIVSSGRQVEVRLLVSSVPFISSGFDLVPLVSRMKSVRGPR